MATEYTHVFTETGNGFPEDGDVVVCDNDGDITLLKIVGSSPIHTTQTGSGHGNYVYLVCKPCARCWDDMDEAEQDDFYDNGFHVGPIDQDSDEDVPL
jgi:hypothetical protein